MDNNLNKQLISSCFNNYEGIITANLMFYKQINDIEIQIKKENKISDLFQNSDAEILQMDDLLGLQVSSLKTIKLLKEYIVRSLSMYIYTLNVINEMSPLLNAILLMTPDKNGYSLVEELSELEEQTLQNGGAKSSVYNLLLNFMVLILINSLYNKNVAANEIIPGINMGLQLSTFNSNSNSNSNQPDVQTPKIALDELDPNDMTQMKAFLQMFTRTNLQDYSDDPSYESKNITSSFGEKWRQDNTPQNPPASMLDGFWNVLNKQDSNIINNDDLFKHVDEGVTQLNKLNRDMYKSLEEMCEATMEVRTDDLPIELYRVLKQKMKDKGEFIEEEQRVARYENKEKALEIATEEISPEDKPEEPTIYEKYVDNSWLKTFSLSTSAEINTEIVEVKSKSKIASYEAYQDSLEQRKNELVPILNEASDKQIMNDAIISILNDVGAAIEDGNINNNRNIFFGSICKIIDVPIFKFDKQSGILSMSNNAESLNYIKVLANNVNTWGKKYNDAASDDLKPQIQSLMEKSQYIVSNVLPSLNVGIVQAITKGTDLSQNVDEFFEQIIDAIDKSKFQIINAISKNPITNKKSNERFMQDYENAQRKILESTREQALAMEEFKTSQNISNEQWEMTQEYLTSNIQGIGKVVGNTTAATLDIVEDMSESVIDTAGNIGIKVGQKGAELISSGLMPFVTSLIWLALGTLAAFGIFVIIRTTMPIFIILGKRVARSMEAHDTANQKNDQKYDQKNDSNSVMSSEQKTYVPPPRPPQIIIQGQGNNRRQQIILAPMFDLVAEFGKPPLPPQPLPPTTRYTRWGPPINSGGKKVSFRKGKKRTTRTKGEKSKKGKKGSKSKKGTNKRRTRKNRTKRQKKTRKR